MTDTPDVRLKALATKIATDNLNSFDNARDAFFKAVKVDAELLWELFKSHRAPVINSLITQSMDEVRRARRGETMPDLEACPLDTHQKRGPKLGSSMPRRNPMIGLAALAEVTNAALLSTYRIDDKPLGNVTPRKALRWASRRDRDYRFVTMLCAGLPKDEPIGKHRTNEEARRMHEMAGYQSGFSGNAGHLKVAAE